MADETTRGNVTKLLVIDDDPSMVRLLESILTESLKDCVEIESLTDPEQARQRILESSIDILLTDLEMPGINGLELLRCAKRRNAFTQVLFLTGHSTRSALLDAMELGATDYILKPVNKDELLELVSQAHSRRQRWIRALAGTWRKASAESAEEATAAAK